jgi:hypothetical protein
LLAQQRPLVDPTEQAIDCRPTHPLEQKHGLGDTRFRREPWTAEGGYEPCSPD